MEPKVYTQVLDENERDDYREEIEEIVSSIIDVLGTDQLSDEVIMFLHNLAPKLPISENIIKLEDFIPYMDSVLTDTDNAISVLKYINEVLKLPHQSLIDMVINHLLAIFLHYEVPFDANDDFYHMVFELSETYITQNPIMFPIFLLNQFKLEATQNNHTDFVLECERLENLYQQLNDI